MKKLNKNFNSKKFSVETMGNCDNLCEWDCIAGRRGCEPENEFSRLQSIAELRWPYKNAIEY